MFKAIVFDFDGVILESADIKTSTFRDLFSGCPGSVDRIVQYHRENAGISRYEKFKVIYRDFLGRDIDASELARLGDEFSRLAFEQVLACPFVDGVRDFLDACAGPYSLFVCSGTPETELLDIVQKRNLERLFRGVYGSPATKPEILARIFAENDLRPTQVVYVGDAMTDLEAARLTGTHFIGRVAPGDVSPFPEAESFPLVENFVGALLVLERLMASSLESAILPRSLPAATPARRQRKGGT